MNFSIAHSLRPRLGVAPRVVALLIVLMVGVGATTVTWSQEIPAPILAVYSVAGFPDTCEQEAGCSLTFTFKNESPDSTTLLNRATLETPAAFDVFDVGAVTTSPLVGEKTWLGDHDGDTVTIEADDPILDALGPNETVSVVVDLLPTGSGLLGTKHAFVTRAFGVVLPNPETSVEFSQRGSEPSVTVVTDQARCEPDADLDNNDCQAQAELGAQGELLATSATAVASDGTTLQYLSLSVGGTFGEGSECLTSASFDPVGHAVTTDLTDPPDRFHIVTITLGKDINNSPGAPGAERIQICAISDKEFTTKSGNQATVGLLPNCPALLPATEKCVLSRSRSAGKTVIRYFVEPGDPISIPGLGEL
jgi:hypothetical protein